MINKRMNNQLKPEYGTIQSSIGSGWYSVLTQSGIVLNIYTTQTLVVNDKVLIFPNLKGLYYAAKIN